MPFIRGRVGDGKTFAVIAQLEGEQGENLDAWQVGIWQNGNWSAESLLGFKPVDLVFMADGHSWLVLGEEGDVVVIEIQDGKAYTRGTARIGDGTLPSFTALARYRSGYVATGMQRLVWACDGDIWRPVGQGLPLEEPGELVGFESLAVHDNTLYACGWKGEVWELDHDHWQRLDVPTNLVLSEITVSPEGEVGVCGRMGTLLLGGGETWRVVDSECGEDFWSIAHFRRQWYVASMRCVRAWEDGQLNPVDDGTEDATYYALSANSEILLSVGAGTILLYDGQDWERII